MKTKIAALAAIAGLLAGVVTMGLASPGSTANAEGPARPGMCNGRTDASVVINAHANGQPSLEVPKYILNISSDAEKNLSGTLIVGKGTERVLVEDWCRLWLHQPGDVPGGGSGQCEDGDAHDPNDEGAINAHAVGIGWHMGQQVLVRTDVRQSEGEIFFRVRWRAMGEHHEEGAIAAAEEEGGCEDEGWTRIPAEEWAALDQLIVH